MKSLRSRLADRKEEILEYTKAFGRLRAMDHYAIRDYICFSRWLEEVTHDKTYGLNYETRLSSHHSLADQIVEAFIRKVATLEAENQKLEERIKLLEWELSHAAEKEETQALAVLQVCKL